jgi:hypothetical protein
MPQISVAELEEEVARLRRELAEASERQSATDEVLRIIASSPADAQPVFDTIVRNFVRSAAAHSERSIPSTANSCTLPVPTASHADSPQQKRRFVNFCRIAAPPGALPAGGLLPPDLVAELH